MACWLKAGAFKDLFLSLEFNKEICYSFVVFTSTSRMRITRCENIHEIWGKNSETQFTNIKQTTLLIKKKNQKTKKTRMDYSARIINC